MAHGPCLGPVPGHGHDRGTARLARRPVKARRVLGPARHAVPPGRASTARWTTILHSSYTTQERYNGQTGNGTLINKPSSGVARATATATSMAVAAAAVATDDTVSLVELPTSAGAEPPPVSASQGSSTVVPELPTCDHELRPSRWQRARCCSSPLRWKRAEQMPEPGERRQPGDMRVSCWLLCSS